MVYFRNLLCASLILLLPFSVNAGSKFFFKLLNNCQCINLKAKVDTGYSKVSYNSGQNPMKIEPGQAQQSVWYVERGESNQQISITIAKDSKNTGSSKCLTKSSDSGDEYVDEEWNKAPVAVLTFYLTGAKRDMDGKSKKGSNSAGSAVTVSGSDKNYIINYKCGH
ncbi:hypothetical protein [Legionella shakespearei]|uniref:Uncharacterized protein n=1 Tax=Legionella shakespearei DSM 23087 TaxID=1122169 RepID=A0A0W0YKN7_9GAMM|nr:hypothetical protein [Legionella shakespearei]KTD57481.1 hypothetical protein Lsha_2322 [Legionella shakespearei DSM 23087]